MIKKVILGIIIAIGAFVLLVILLFVAFVFYSININTKVDAAAKTFCSSIRTGADIDNVIKTAESKSQRNHLYAYEGVYRFTFAGAIFHASTCTVTTEAGKVVSTQLQVFDD